MTEEGVERRAVEETPLDELWLCTLQELYRLAEQPVGTIAGFTVERAIASTGSEVGYVAFLNEDETALTVHSCNSSIAHGRETTPQTYPVTDPGPWAEAVRQRSPLIANACASPSPWIIGCPPVHGEVVRQMNVPVLDGGRIVVVAGVANKETEYDERDLRQLTLLTESMWLVLRRRDAEDRSRDAAEALGRSEAYLAEAERLSHTGSWAFDVASNKYVHVSEECRRIFELDGRAGVPTRGTISRLIHPEDWDRVQRDYGEAINAREDTSSEFRIVLPSGAVKHVRVIRHPVRNDAGDVVEVIGTVIDVTERKRIEEERSNHVRFLESLGRVDSAMHGTDDLERMMGDVLDTVLEIFGAERAWLVHPCDPDAAAWRAVMEHTRPEFPGAFAVGVEFPMTDEIVGMMRAARDSDRPVVFGPDCELQIPERIAEQFSIQSQMLVALHPISESPYLFGLHQCSHPRAWSSREVRLFEEIGHRLTDALTTLLILRNLRESERRLERELTKLRQAESELRVIETRFRECVDFAADMLWLHSDDGTIIDVNRQSCECLGYSRDELIGRTVLRGIEVDHEAVVFQSIVERVRSGEIVTFETHYRRKDGTVFPVEVRTRRFFQSGQMYGISLVRDISERRRVEAELREAQATLAHQQRVSMLGELAAALTHEINQPIAGVMIDATACLRALTADRLDIDEARRAAARIVREATWADEIISRTRALYRKDKARHERVDVNAVIHEIAVLFRRETPREITIQTDLAEDLPDAMVDRVQLQQVLMNLLLNAVEAMKDTGGAMTISSRVEEDGDLRISVSDTGVGLPTHAAERIFDPFVTTKKQGTGMGLAISRTIVESHGGRLWASSNARAGATFHFTLRSASDAQSAPLS